MKKFVAILLTLTLSLSMLAFTAQADEAATPSVAIVVAGTLGDRSFYDSANEGIEQLKADFGTAIAVIECHEGGDGVYGPALRDAADEYDVVCAVGWQFWDVLADGEILEEYPDVKFLFIDNPLDGVGDNLMSIVYMQNEGSFLVGYIAAKLSETGKIGAVGGEDSETINDFIVGYKAGAEYANPDIEVLVQYAGNFEDPAKGKQCALALYDAGCDVVFQVAGKTGEGVFEAASERKKLAIGVDGDQKFINPDVIICSMVKKVGKSIYDVVANVNDMFQGNTIWAADMETGYIDVVYGTPDMPQQVPDELKAEVEALKALIISGEIVVPSITDKE